MKSVTVNDNNTIDQFYSQQKKLFENTVDNIVSNTQLNAAPYSNIKEFETSYEIEVAVPGVKKKNLQVQVSDGILTVRARKHTSKKKATNFVSDDVYIRRDYTLPEDADGDKAKAKYRDGMLRVCIPKNKTLNDKVRRIKIQVASDNRVINQALKKVNAYFLKIAKRSSKWLDKANGINRFFWHKIDGFIMKIKRITKNK